MPDPDETTVAPPAVAGRAVRALDTLHSAMYFAPEADQALAGAGLRPGRMTYFAGRSAPMGAVPPEVVAATFYNFNPDLVARYIPRAWTLATPEAVLEARLVAADRTMRRLLGDALDGDEVRELAELTRAAAEGLDVAGRPLFAGHARLPWPDEAHLALWHAITLLREYRGDAHVAALLTAGIGGLDALVLHTLTGRGFTVAAAQASRGWSPQQWDGAVARLAGRGLIESVGAAGGTGLTQAGTELRAGIETVTDLGSGAPWTTLGAERTGRVIELGKGLSRRAVAAGAFPPGVFESGH